TASTNAFSFLLKVTPPSEIYTLSLHDALPISGFALMAYLAYRDKQAADAQFRRVLPLIEREAYDDRNFVRKAVNWALRNIGKRNLRLNREATRTAARIRRQDSPSARWIAANALRELKSAAVQARLRRRASAGQ